MHIHIHTYFVCNKSNKKEKNTKKTNKNKKNSLQIDINYIYRYDW